MSEPRYKIKNWKKFQHFTDRRPPWIRLYRELIRKEEWVFMDPAHCKTLIGLWLVASDDKEKEGNLPGLRQLSLDLSIPIETLRAHVSELSQWLEVYARQDDPSCIQVVHKPGTSCIQSVLSDPETETETETETDPPLPPKNSQTDFGLEPQAPPADLELATCIRELPGIWNQAAKAYDMIRSSADRTSLIRALWKECQLFRDNWREIGMVFAANPWNRGLGQGKGTPWKANLDYALRGKTPKNTRPIFETAWEKYLEVGPPAAVRPGDEKGF